MVRTIFQTFQCYSDPSVNVYHFLHELVMTQIPYMNLELNTAQDKYIEILYGCVSMHLYVIYSNLVTLYSDYFSVLFLLRLS